MEWFKKDCLIKTIGFLVLFLLANIAVAAATATPDVINALKNEVIQYDLLANDTGND